MKKIVVVPLDPIERYLNNKRTYEYLEEYFNPGDYFDEVYCVTPWCKDEEKCNVKYIQTNLEEFGKTIREINPDVVRAYGGFRCGNWVIAAKQQNVPVVISVHDTKFDRIHHCIEYADVVACTSEAVISQIKNKLSISNRIFYRPNGIDTNLFRKIQNKDIFERFNQRYGRGGEKKAYSTCWKKNGTKKYRYSYCGTFLFAPRVFCGVCRSRRCYRVYFV